jgi:hypothetical protein
MNAQVTNEIRELTAEELEAVNGGANDAWGAARVIGRMIWDTGQAGLGIGLLAVYPVVESYLNR